MKRKKRTWILIEDKTETARKIAELIEEAYDIVILDEPIFKVIMNQIRESAENTLFYGGEVLVTYTRTTINNQIGEGIVMGEEPKLSYYLAVIDSGYKVASNKEQAIWNTMLEKAEKKIISRMLKNQSTLEETKVSFETMDAKE